MTTQRAHYPASEREILSMTEACQYLGVKGNTMLRLIREGRNLKHCANELFTNAMKASREEVRVIIEVGKEDQSGQ